MENHQALIELTRHWQGLVADMRAGKMVVLDREQDAPLIRQLDIIAERGHYPDEPSGLYSFADDSPEKRRQKGSAGYAGEFPKSWAETNTNKRFEERFDDESKRRKELGLPYAGVVPVDIPGSLYRQTEEAVAEGRAAPVILRGELESLELLLKWVGDRMEGKQSLEHPMLVLNGDGFWKPITDALGLEHNRLNIHITHDMQEMVQATANHYLVEDKTPSAKSRHPIHVEKGNLVEGKFIIPKDAVILAATGTASKIRDFGRMFSGTNIQVESLKHYMALPEAVEDTFRETGNALQKLEVQLETAGMGKGFNDGMEHQKFLQKLTHQGHNPEKAFILCEDSMVYAVDPRVMEIFNLRGLINDSVWDKIGELAKAEGRETIETNLQTLKQYRDRLDAQTQEQINHSILPLERSRVPGVELKPIMDAIGVETLIERMHDSWDLLDVKEEDRVVRSSSTIIIAKVTPGNPQKPEHMSFSGESYFRLTREVSHDKDMNKLDSCSVPTSPKTDRESDEGALIKKWESLVENYKSLAEKINEVKGTKKEADYRKEQKAVRKELSEYFHSVEGTSRAKAIKSLLVQNGIVRNAAALPYELSTIQQPHIMLNAVDGVGEQQPVLADREEAVKSHTTKTKHWLQRIKATGNASGLKASPTQL